MSKASEIMERLDAIDPDEAIGDDKDMFYFRAVDALIKALTGNEIWWTSPLQDGIAEIREALREAFGELEARALPEGCEWPRFEDGELVRIGDEYECWCGKAHFVRSVTIKDGRSVLNESQSHSFVVSDGHFISHGERVKRTQVLAADGEPLEVGQTVWFTTSGREIRVDKIEHRPDGFWALELFADGSKSDSAPAVVLTHQRPVLDADGVPIHDGDTVWRLADGKKFEVTGVDHQARDIRVKDDSMGLGVWDFADGFTHTKPEHQDSWERIEEDARLMLDDGLHDNDEWVLDLVRRCKKLAEKESK